MAHPILVSQIKTPCPKESCKVACACTEADRDLYWPHAYAPKRVSAIYSAFVAAALAARQVEDGFY